MRDHLPAHYCAHVFTAACPIDCLRAVLGTATFHALARAEHAPFPRPTVVGEVVGLWRAGRLSLVAGLGPRRLGEIEAGLVLAGFVLTDATGPGQGVTPPRADDPACPGGEERPSW